MLFKELGKTGIQLSEVGLGTWRYHGGVAALRAGLEAGANWIDTAEVYGSEEIVGDAIHNLPSEPLIATKVSGNHLRRKELLKAAEVSLKRLRIDCIDLYQVHWPDSNVPIAETMGAMEELVDAGKIRYIGVSNFNVAETKAAQAALRKHKVISNQVSFSLFDRTYERDLLPYCVQQQITLLAYSPLGQGALKRRGKGLEVLQEVAREAGKSPAQVAINWCIQPGTVAIAKSDDPDRNRQNCEASGWELSPALRERLERTFR